MPGAEAIGERLKVVLATIYLLFNEGYYSARQPHPLRKELCYEAMRLCHFLLENEQTNKPEVNALMALMCFHASRFDARANEQGELILYADQDTGLWNSELVSRGGYFLRCAATGNTLTRYHLEAGIAYWNTQGNDSIRKWEQILHYYNLLLQIDYSPIAALNRTFALAKVKGKPAAIIEAEKLGLEDYHFYYALLGELYSGVDDEQAKENYRKALAKSPAGFERRTIEKKLTELEGS